MDARDSESVFMGHFHPAWHELLLQPFFFFFFWQLNSRRDDIMTSTWDHRLKYFIYELTSAYVFQNVKWQSFDQIHHLHIGWIKCVRVVTVTHNDDRSHCLIGCHFPTWFTFHRRDHKGRWTATWGPLVIGEEHSIIFICYKIILSGEFES